MSKIFPKSANKLPLQIVVFVVVFANVALAGIWYYATPKYTRVGYAPVQPIPFDHSLHAGQLGLDCRYCHTNVEISEHSNIPATSTCMACHSLVKNTSPLLQPLRDSAASGDPVPWVRIHKAPDYVYFNHSVHVNRGVSCVECHGKINEMKIVAHDQPQSMSWCLDCHRHPEQRIRDSKDVFNLDSLTLAAQGRLTEAEQRVKDWKINPPQSCSGCHR